MCNQKLVNKNVCCGYSKELSQWSPKTHGWENIYNYTIKKWAHCYFGLWLFLTFSSFLELRGKKLRFGHFSNHCLKTYIYPFGMFWSICVNIKSNDKSSSASKTQNSFWNSFPTTHNNCCCVLSHLFMYFGSIKCKQYGPRSDCFHDQK